MFLIGLFFTGAVAFHNGGLDWLKNPHLIPQVIKHVIILWFIVTTFDPLIKLRSFQYGEYIPWLRTLTDAPIKSDLEMLPTQDVIDQTLTIIQSEVDKAKLRGDILFIDQRQLLTFEYIRNVPFVPEYEKKLLMNEALSSDQSYFQGFYDDLAAHRFSLIISEPLRSPIKDSSYEFGEENNAWVTWVSIPVLCYYEPLETLKEVKVQLLIPKSEPNNCLELLP
jgi:hypothetical protein